jgi:hypothetical protein
LEACGCECRSNQAWTKPLGRRHTLSWALCTYFTISG